MPDTTPIRGTSEPATHDGGKPESRSTTVIRALATVSLLAVSWLPLHRLLSPSSTGLAGSATRAAAEVAWQQSFVGSALVLAGAVVLGRWVAPATLRRAARTATATLLRPPLTVVAVAAGGVATTLATTIAVVHFDLQPTSVDEMVQLLHARTLLSGRIALPVPSGLEAHWALQNSVFTPAGWASVYPPGHTLLLAAGMAMGAPWIVGPILLGVAVTATVWAVARAVPDHPSLARWSAVALAWSPFLLVLGATHLSHTPAAALTALAFLGAVLARMGPSLAAAVGSGLASGLLLATRPWTGVVMGAAAAVTCAVGKGDGRSRVAWPRAAAFCAGAFGPALALLAWNRELFGHPLRLGYTAAFGPAHGLGFHRDPWGNMYGVLEAFAYSASDLSQMGVHLLQTALPALAVLGLATGLRVILPRGLRLVAAWALAGVASIVPYWHHGLHFGPRLLYETAPLVAVLTVAALRGLWTIPARSAWLRNSAVWGVTLTLGSALVTIPLTLVGPIGAPEAPDVRLEGLPDSTLVFVHGSWASRTAARLAAAGMRRDSIETALRRNGVCAAHRYAVWRGAMRGVAPPIDFDPQPGSPGRLQRMLLSEGNAVSVDPATPFSPACAREANADATGGSVELEPLLWRVPPLPAARVILARDLGPEANARLIARLPGYGVRMLTGSTATAPEEIVDYADGVARVWGFSDPER